MLIKATDLHGHWVDEPPAIIKPGQTVNCEIDTNTTSPFGAEAQVVYGYGDNKTQMILHVACPVVGSNVAKSICMGQHTLQAQIGYGGGVPLNASFSIWINPENFENPDPTEAKEHQLA